MIRLLLPPLLLVACEAETIKLEGGEPVPGDTAADTDTDADPDTDVDPDTDTSEPFDDTAGPELPDWDWYVDCDGAGDFTTIQAAIDAATSGDRIALAPCEYHERIDFRSKYLDIFGVEGSAATIIDGDYGGTVVDVENAEAGGTRLAGVTIEDGYDPTGGSGLEVTYASIVLEDVVFAGNGESWAVARLNVGFVDMIDVVFEDNAILAGGQAIWTDGGILTATRLRADCGDGDYALWQHNATLLLDNELTCEAGYGLYSYHGELQVKRSRIHGGIAGIYAYDEEDSPSERGIVYNSFVSGGSEGARFEYMSVYVANSVLWGPDAGLALLANDGASWAIANVFVDAACGVDADTAYTASYNAFWNVASAGCGTTPRDSVIGDPMFTSFPDDLTPLRGSPLRDAGYPDASWEDADGSRNDIGITGGPWAE